jgi:hypothetical protein
LADGGHTSLPTGCPQSGLIRWLPWALLVVALLVGSWARWVPPVAVADLQFRPDALEYEEAARSLIHGRGYCLRLDGHDYPPRYSIGFPAIIAPFLMAFGDEYGTGIYAVFAFAVLGIVAAFALGRVGGMLTAGVSALVLALTPYHIRWSGAVLSDVPAATLVSVVVVWALYLLRRSGSTPSWCILGLVTGLTATVRWTNLLIVAPIGLALILHWGWRDCRRRVLALGFGSLGGMLPQLIVNTLQFGSPRGSGYAYWMPSDYGPGSKTFSTQFALGAPHTGGTSANLPFYLESLMGRESLLEWPIAALVLLGTFAAWRGPKLARSLALLGLGYTFCLVAFYSLYLYQSERLIVPALPLLAAMAAMSFASWSSTFVKGLATGLLMAAVVIGAPKFLESLPPMNVYFALHIEDAATLRDIDNRVENDAAVLVHSNAFFVERLLRRDTERLWLPIEFCEHRKRVQLYGLRPLDQKASGPEWIQDSIHAPFHPDASERAIVDLLKAGRPVYYSTMVVKELIGFGPQLHQMLEERFQLEQIAAGRWQLFRVKLRS